MGRSLVVRGAAIRAYSPQVLASDVGACSATPHTGVNTGEAVTAWYSPLAPGGTLVVILAHLEKGPPLLCVDTRWGAKAATPAVPGEAKAGGRRVCPRPAIAKQQHVQIATHTGAARLACASGFDQLGSSARGPA